MYWYRVAASGDLASSASSPGAADLGSCSRPSSLAGLASGGGSDSGALGASRAKPTSMGARHVAINRRDE
jgi:hypothetical protein